MTLSGSPDAGPVGSTVSSGAAADTAATDTAVDVHAHAMPLPLLQRLAEQGLADLDGVPDGVVRLDSRVSGVGPWTPLPLARSQYDVPVRLSEMDSAGVTCHAVSLPPFLFASTADDERLATDVVRHGNDELAVYVADAPDRLLGLGSVPLGWPGAADEARRSLDELGLHGIAIGSRGAGRELDDPVNDELWTLLAERRTFIFLHPSGVPDVKRLADFYLPQLAGYPMDTAIAVARLVFGGVLERFPIQVCLAHGGGCVPSLRGRWNMGWERKEVARSTPLPPTDYVDRLYYDTAVFSTTLLRRLVEDVGAGHVMLGTDHPFELADFTPVESVRTLDLDEASTRAILWDNAAGLLDLSVAASAKA
jgi:aminocarboxymuconate-semialdehyde decarboxylase